MRKPNQLHATIVVCGFVPCSHILIFVEISHNTINITGIFQVLHSFVSLTVKTLLAFLPHSILSPLSINKSKKLVNKGEEVSWSLQEHG